MIATLSRQGGRRYPQMRRAPYATAQPLPSNGGVSVSGDFLHGRLTIKPALGGRITVRMSVNGTLGINP